MTGAADTTRKWIRRWPLWLFVAVVCWCGFTGLRTVPQNETGVVLTFGRFSRLAPPGIRVTLPWPIERMERVVTGEIRTMSVGFRLLNRIRSIPPTPEEVQWLTGDTNIVEIQTEVQYLVIDPAKYLFTVADLGDRPRDFVIRKLAESVLTEIVARMTVDDVLSSGKALLSEEGRRGIQAAADLVGLGIQVHSMNIVQADPPPEVISAFNDVNSAKADKERRVSEADGYAKNLLPAARAEANRLGEEAEIYRTETIAAARGDAEGFTLLLARVAAAPAVTKRRILLEELEKILARPKKVVYPRKDGRRFKLTEVE
ncbi:MAG: FtsH protease activity modulator HflK [Planctomycetota bacterium]